MTEWILRRTFRKLFRQGPYHLENLRWVYSIIRSELEREFTEDNRPTLLEVSRECNEQAWDTPHD